MRVKILAVFLSRLCGGEDPKDWVQAESMFLSRLCGGEDTSAFGGI